MLGTAPGSALGLGRTALCLCHGCHSWIGWGSAPTPCVVVRCGGFVSLIPDSDAGNSPASARGATCFIRIHPGRQPPPPPKKIIKPRCWLRSVEEIRKYQIRVADHSKPLHLSPGAVLFIEIRFLNAKGSHNLQLAEQSADHE